jgi:hypothetical protein
MRKIGEMMLRDGKHIKEPPPQIGRYWTRVERARYREPTAEEVFMQAVNLGYDPSGMPSWKILLAKLLRI